MNNTFPKQERCYHCGGVLILAGENTYSCLMCSREMGHRCEFCTNLPSIETSRQTSRNESKKKIGAAR